MRWRLDADAVLSMAFPFWMAVSGAFMVPVGLMGADPERDGRTGEG